MIELAAALETSPPAEILRTGRWAYPLVNAGHVLGLALLVGAVVPMDLRLLGVVRRPDVAATVALLRPFAAAGLALAAACGALLFAAQATDYAASALFRAKMALVALATANALLHPRLARTGTGGRRAAAAVSLALWPSVLILGRLIGYS